MRNFISTLLATVALTFSVSGQPAFPITPAAAPAPVSVTPSVRPSQAVFYDGFDHGYNTPWNFYQGTHLFDTSTTNGVLRLNVKNNIAGQYAYIRTNFTNISVLADIKLYSDSLGSSVGLRYNVTNGANYSAWLYPASGTNSARFVLKKYTNWFKGFELASANVANLGTNTHLVKLSFTNNLIVANLDNTQALAYTDTNSLIPGGISLSILGGNNSSADYDNVTVFDLNQPFIAKPAISEMTKRVITNQGGLLQLKVKASGNPQYKWYFGGSATPIPGATNDTLTISNAQTANAGYYKVTVENLGGSVYGTANATVFTTNILSECNLTNLSKVTFYWNYDFTNNPTVNSFRIYNGINTNIYTNFVQINGQVLTTTVSNLSNDTIYYFSIVARDSVQGLQSDFSSDLTYNTPKWGVKTNLTTNIYFLSAFGYPAIQTKACPNQSVTFWYTPNLSTPFQVLTNIIADQYGNAVYDDVGARNQPQRFYKLSTP